MTVMHQYFLFRVLMVVLWPCRRRSLFEGDNKAVGSIIGSQTHQDKSSFYCIVLATFVWIFFLNIRK